MRQLLAGSTTRTRHALTQISSRGYGALCTRTAIKGFLKRSPTAFPSPISNTIALRTQIRTFSRIPARFSEADPAQARRAADDVRAEMLSRPANIHIDRLSPTSSQLLSLCLSSYVPASCLPQEHVMPKWVDAALKLPGTVARIVGREAIGRFGEGDGEMPPGHHLVYFPTRVRDDELLEDGCDELHWPGAPFMRRLWAGGIIRFNLGKGLRLDCAPAVCLELVDDVRVVGQGQEEKIMVTVRRNYGKPELLRRIIEEQDKEEIHRSVRSEDAGDWAILEERKLVFLRHKTHEQVVEGLETKDRVIKSTYEPTFSIHVRPSRDLLFRFSALTFNAHKIHLQAPYARRKEGYRDLLVHGPLSLVLMLSVLQSQLKANERILSLEYKNLMPLFVEEEMKICICRPEEQPNQEVVPAAGGGGGGGADNKKVNVWIEGEDGGQRVKGTAVIATVPPEESILDGEEIAEVISREQL